MSPMFDGVRADAGEYAQGGWNAGRLDDNQTSNGLLSNLRTALYSTTSNFVARNEEPHNISDLRIFDRQLVILIGMLSVTQ